MRYLRSRASLGHSGSLRQLRRLKAAFHALFRAEYLSLGPTLNVAGGVHSEVALHAVSSGTRHGDLTLIDGPRFAHSFTEHCLAIVLELSFEAHLHVLRETTDETTRRALELISAELASYTFRLNAHIRVGRRHLSFDLEHAVNLEAIRCAIKIHTDG